MNWKEPLQISSNLLSREEISRLNTEGFVGLGKLLGDSDIEMINARLAQLQDIEGSDAGAELLASKYIRHPKEAGADRLADLVNKGSIFDVFYSHPRALAAINLVLGDDMKLSSLNYRAAKPGMGQQKLHVDWKDGKHNGTYRVCNSIWLLDDFTASNGATRVVPGSHLWDLNPDDILADPLAPHPEEILIQGPAGSVFIFNSHVWHGGTMNQTDLPRRSIHSYFCTRDQNQQINQRQYLTPQTRSRLAPASLYILDAM